MEQNTEQRKLTLGERRVGVNFNPSGLTVVDSIKRKSADLIDLCEALRREEYVKPENDTPQALQENAGEKFRVISLAQTAFEEAAMWAVKAATMR